MIFRRAQIGLVLAVGSMLAAIRTAGAQSNAAASNCDSIIATARVDSVLSGIFLEVRQVDGPLLTPAVLRQMALRVGAMFTMPTPLRLSVFRGPVRTHLLRPVGGDTLPDLRAPNITGIYALMSVPGDSSVRVETVRSSLMLGFDSAATTSIRRAATGDSLFHLKDDSLRVAVRLTTDSLPGAVRLVTAYFPRMPVVDAIALPSNPPPQFPDSVDADGADRGEVVLRFVVTREGLPAINAMEILRATSSAFLEEAVKTLGDQHFRPATIKGCAIAELIEYPFTFFKPGGAP